jgi:hypothetical protein
MSKKWTLTEVRGFSVLGLVVEFIPNPLLRFVSRILT